jgi:integrase
MSGRGFHGSPSQLVLAGPFLIALDLLGTFVTALSGAAAEVKSNFDLFGLMELAFAAGNARRITRDLLIGAVPPAAITDLCGKGGRIRTVAVPIWVKQGIEVWMGAANIKKGMVHRPLSKSGKIVGDELGDLAIWSVVEQSSKQIGIEHFGAHDLRRTCAKLCRKNGGDLEQIKFLLGHSSIQTTERYLGSEQEIVIAVNDNLGL